MSDTTTETATLGDCLLHLTHHAMTQECWVPVIDHYMQVVGDRLSGPEDLDALRAEAVNKYKATYERALLDAIRNGEISV